MLQTELLQSGFLQSLVCTVVWTVAGHHAECCIVAAVLSVGQSFILY
jgi:hypothetical protein